MKMQKIEVHIKNTEKWIKLIQEDLELINDKEDYLHGHYITPDIDESEITVFKGFVEEDIVKIIYIHEKNPFNINEVVMFDGKLENRIYKGNSSTRHIDFWNVICVVFMHGMDQSDRFCSVYDKFCNNNNDR